MTTTLHTPKTDAKTITAKLRRETDDSLEAYRRLVAKYRENTHLDAVLNVRSRARVATA